MLPLGDDRAQRMPANRNHAIVLVEREHAVDAIE